MPNTAARPSAPASMAPLRSLLPVSTPTTRWTGRVWFTRASVARGIHAAPSWATMTAVTTCWARKLFGDTDPLAAQSGHLPDAQTGSGPFPAWWGHPVNNTRSHGERSGRPQDPGQEYPGPAGRLRRLRA